MLTVVGVDVVPRFEASTEPHHRGLFTQIEMAIAANASLLIHLCRFFLKAADQHHLVIVVEQRLAVLTLG